MKRAGALVLAAVALTGLAASAQTPSLRLTSRAEAVRIDALVTDGRKPVAGLTAADFEVRDNGVLQQPTLVAPEETPLNVYLVLDTSSSLMEQRLKSLTAAATSLLSALRPIDKVGLVTFDHQVRLRSPLTSDPKALMGGLSVTSGAGATAVRDAVFLTLALRENDEARTLMILLSDGEDTASWLSAAKVLDAARQSDVVAYAVAPRTGSVNDDRLSFSTRVTPVASALAGGFMRELTETTGGRGIYAYPDSDMRAVFSEIVQEFQGRYLLGYIPTGVSGTGWHQVEVKVKGRRTNVTARRGYFAR